jgi:hypothetical protein
MKITAAFEKNKNCFCFDSIGKNEIIFMGSATLVFIYFVFYFAIERGYFKTKCGGKRR